MTKLDKFNENASKRDYIMVCTETELTLIKPIINNRDPKILTIFDEHHKTYVSTCTERICPTDVPIRLFGCL